MKLGVEHLFTRNDMSFLGHAMQQTWSSLLMLEKVLSENKDVVRLVELGTGCGGLTLFWGLHMAMRSGRVLTLDINRWMAPAWQRWASLFNIAFEQRNVFDQTTVQRVRDFIRDGRALVFCDDGDKPRELPLYASILKRNDLVMVHDWGSEIKREHLTPEVMSLLRFYRQDEFDALKTTILSLVRV